MVSWRASQHISEGWIVIVCGQLLSSSHDGLDPLAQVDRIRTYGHTKGYLNELLCHPPLVTGKYIK